MIQIQVINNSKTALPEYMSPMSSGMDLRACWDSFKDNEYEKIKLYSPTYSSELDFHEDLTAPLILKPGDRALIPTGLQLAIPEGYECQVRPRSGLALKYGITVLNSPGTIDASYRGSIGIILINEGYNNFKINHGDRIAQLVLNSVELIIWDQVLTLDTTERGEGGFGHSGVK